MGFVLFGLSLLSLFSYLFNEANSFMEYTQSVYMTGAIILIGLSYAIIVIQMKKLFEFIGFVENLHSGKKSDHKYEQMYLHMHV